MWPGLFLGQVLQEGMGRLLIDGSPGNEIVDVVKPVDARLQRKRS